MVVQVYLNDTLLADEPKGIREITEIIERDDSIHGYVVKYNQITLSFYGDGYLFIKNIIRLNGYENRVSIKIVIQDSGGYTDTIDAYFFTTDVEFNTKDNTYIVQLEDNNFGAFLKSGAKEKITPSAVLSRNGETIAPATTDAITLFTPSTGVNLGTDARVYDIQYVMELLVKYLSDNNLQFSFNATLPYRYGLTKHYFILNRGNIPDNQISFQDLMDFYWRAFGLMFWIDASYEQPIFSIDREETLMEAAGNVLFSDVYDLKVTFDQDKMYSTVALGSSKELVDRGAVVYQLPFAPLIGFGEENVNARSVAMLDNELDLTLDNFICGTNKIESFLSSTSYDETHTIIQYALLTNEATKGTYGINGVTRLYNETLLNFNILSNHLLPITMVSELGADTDGFLAYMTSDIAVPSVEAPLIFDDASVHGFNNNSNYNNATGIYTIPFDGVYRFQVAVWLDIFSLIQYFALPNGVQVLITVNRNGTPYSTQTIVTNGVGLEKNFTYEFEGLFTATDTIEIDITTSFLLVAGTGTNTANLKGFFTYTDSTGRPAFGGTSFKTIFVWNSGGAVVNPDSSDYPAVNYDFKYPIDLKSWRLLRARPVQGVTVNTNTQNNTLSWIKKISRNWITGESDVTLFTKLSENNIL